MQIPHLTIVAVAHAHAVRFDHVQRGFLYAPAPGPSAAPGGFGPIDTFADEILDQASKPGEDTFTEVCGEHGCRDNCMDYSRYITYCRSVADPEQAFKMQSQYEANAMPGYAYKCLRGGNAPCIIGEDNCWECHEQCTVFNQRSSHDMCICDAAYLSIPKSRKEHDEDCILNTTFNKLAKTQDVWAYAGRFVSEKRMFEMGKNFDELDSNHDGSISEDEAGAHGHFSPLHHCADENKDGKISRQEFQDKTPHGLSTCEQSSAEREKACRSLDSDGDDKLSYSEWKKWGEAIDCAMHATSEDDLNACQKDLKNLELLDQTLPRVRTPKCVDADDDGSISLEECVEASGIDHMNKLMGCDRCSNWQSDSEKIAKENSELTAKEASECEHEDETGHCWRHVMEYPDFHCMDTNQDLRISTDECMAVGEQMDSMQKKNLFPESDEVDLDKWAEKYFEEKAEEKKKKASLLAAPAPGPGGPGGPAPGPPPRPDTFLECRNHMYESGNPFTWPTVVEPPAAPASPAGGPGSPGPAPEAPAAIGMLIPAPAAAPSDVPKGVTMHMDLNGDGKVSRQEAYNYAIAMPGADISSVKVDKIFRDADRNRDNYLTEKEFAMAGKHHAGDGPGK